MTDSKLAEPMGFDPSLEPLDQRSNREAIVSTRD